MTTAAHNIYTSSSTDPYTINLSLRGSKVPLTVHQTDAEPTWPGGALWDPGVVLVKLFQTAFDPTNKPPPSSHPSIQALSALFLLRDSTVVELGCGVGLTGIALGALGAKYVAVTDMPEVRQDERRGEERTDRVERANEGQLYTYLLLWFLMGACDTS